jgi:hypothetical protein
MSPQIAEIIFVKKALVGAEVELREKHFPGVGTEGGAAYPAQALFLAANHEPVQVKVAPIECDLEQVVQRGNAAVATHVQTPPNGRVNLQEQDVELVNLGGSIRLDHRSSRSLIAGVRAPDFSRSPFKRHYTSLRGAAYILRNGRGARRSVLVDIPSLPLITSSSG